jgi:hypothetical protein
MWYVILLVVLIIIGYFVYTRKTATLRLSKEQLELMKDLIAKERERIKIQKQEIIDQGSREGKTIPLAPILDKLDELKADNQGNAAFIAEIDRQKNKLIKKYGTQIPVDEAYKMLTDYEEKHGPI